MASTRRIRWGLALTLLAFGVIAFFTLRPSPEDAEAAAASSFLCLFPCGDQALRDAILNTILFVPLGLALGLWLPPLRAWLLTLLTTCAIEFTQYAWLLGRDASLRDILTNALGGAVGVLLIGRWRVLVHPGRMASRWLTGAALLGWLMVVATGARLVRPALPASVYWGQWVPELGQFETWRGTLLGLTVDDHPVPSGRLQQSERLRALLQQDSVTVRVRIVTGAAPADLAPIAAVFDSDQREIFVLGQWGHDLVFRIRTGLRNLELGGQTIALRDAVGGAGDSMLVEAGLDHGAWVIRTEGPRGRRLSTRVPFSAGLVWSGLVPYEIAIDQRMEWINAIWLGALLLPAGYWLRGVRRRPVWLVALGAAAAAGLAVLVWRAGLAAPSSWEWSAVLLGPTAGWLLQDAIAAALDRHDSGGAPVTRA